jgi:hypothetical protein
MCSTWVFFSQQCCRFPERRKVSAEIATIYDKLNLIIPRQLNIDYAVCQSLMTIPPDLRVITIYDVACQWSIHFQKRVEESPYLEIPKGISLVPAVGKWHLGAHVPECFPKYSLNFVDGIGQIDGEILETLWWPIDKVAGVTRAMSKAHRQEVLDDNMYDSNWKKWVGIGASPQIKLLGSFFEVLSAVASLCRKYKKAETTVETMNSAVEELTESIGNGSWISEWKKLEEVARRNRGEKLMIYNVSHTPGESLIPVVILLDLSYYG